MKNSLLSKKLLAKGNYYYIHKKYDKAIELYNDALNINNKEYLLFFNRGLAEKELSLYKNAKNDFIKCLNLNPKNTEALNSLSNIYIILGRYGEAFIEQEKCTNLDPSNYQNQSNLIKIKQLIQKEENLMIHLKEENYEEVEILCKELLIDSSGCSDLKIRYIEALFNNNKITEAFTYLDKSLTHDDKNDLRFEILKAKLKYYDGLFFESKEILIKNKNYIIDKNIKNKEILLQIEELFDKIEKIEEIEKIKTTANNYFKQGNYDDAINEYTKILSFDPSNKKYNSIIYRNISLCYEKKERYLDALRNCDKCIKLAPNYAKGYLKRANIFINLGIYDEAFKNFEKAKDLDNKLDSIDSLIKNTKKLNEKQKIKDYYKILGIDKFANEQDIYKAYKVMIKQYHPDKNSDSEQYKNIASKITVNIVEAFSILSDYEKRLNYDINEYPFIYEFSKENKSSDTRSEKEPENNEEECKSENVKNSFKDQSEEDRNNSFFNSEQNSKSEDSNDFFQDISNEDQNKSDSESEEFEKENIECPYCHKIGHNIPKCPKLDCKICFKHGHPTVKCRKAFCKKCHKKGHLSIICQNI